MFLISSSRIYCLFFYNFIGFITDLLYLHVLLLNWSNKAKYMEKNGQAKRNEVLIWNFNTPYKPRMLYDVSTQDLEIPRNTLKCLKTHNMYGSLYPYVV